MKRGIIIIWLAFLLPCLLYAQEETAKPQQLSLEEAVEFAVKHNKELQASQLDIELRKQMITESISQGLPQVSGSLEYSTNFGKEMDFGGNGIKMEDRSSLGVSVSQLLFNGQWIVGLKTSKIAKEVAEQQVDIDEQTIKENVYNSYYTILVTQRLVGILENNLDNMHKIMEHTLNMYKAGTVEETDADQIRITVGQLKNSLLSMQRTLDVNYNLMRIQLGLQAGTPIILTDELEGFLGEEGFLTLAAKDFDINSNLEYQLTLTQERLQEKMVALQKWAFAPSINASYAYQYLIKKGGFGSIPHTASVSMTIPIFSGLQRKSQLKQEQITLEQTQITRSLLEDNLQLQEEQYKFNLRNALENYNLQKENITVAKKVLESYQNKYNVGTISSLDLTQANNNYLEAENNYTSACLTLLEAQTQLLKLYNELK